MCGRGICEKTSRTSNFSAATVAKSTRCDAGSISFASKPNCSIILKGQQHLNPDDTVLSLLYPFCSLSHKSHSFCGGFSRIAEVMALQPSQDRGPGFSESLALSDVREQCLCTDAHRAFSQES